MTDHTPTPWEAQPFDAAEYGVGIVGLRTNAGIPYSNPTNGLVGWATMLPTEIDANDPARAEANAAFIVKAVNNHERFERALRQIADQMLTNELELESEGDFEGAYDILIGIAREALRVSVGGT